MNDPIRTPAETLEAAAREAESLAGQVADASLTGLPEQARLRESMEAAFTKAAVRIRALAPRIAAPDDEALVEVARKALGHGCPSSAFELGKCDQAACSCRDDAMTIIAALREAGALR